MNEELLLCRIKKLESENKWIKFGFLGICLSIGLLFFYGATKAPEVQDEIRAKKFVLVDEKGATCAELSVKSSSTGLIIYNESGEARAGLTISYVAPSGMEVQGGYGVAIYNEKQQVYIPGYHN